MRFKRSDLPGLAIAALAPPLLTLLFLASFDVWHHEGTPLIGFMAGNFAGAVGTMAIFSRFVRNWTVPLALAGLLAVFVAGVIWAQQAGHDGTALATGLKWAALIDFMVLNLAVGLQVITNALLPVLDRRDARRAAGGPS